MKDAHRYEIVDEERRLEWRSYEEFDRIAFAMHALRILRPNMTVAVYQTRRNLKIERGHDLANGPDAFWAMVGIPRDASREHIARALAELAGYADTPFIVDLIAQATDPATKRAAH